MLLGLGFALIALSAAARLPETVALATLSMLSKKPEHQAGLGFGRKGRARVSLECGRLGLGLGLGAGRRSQGLGSGMGLGVGTHLVSGHA